MGNEGEITRRQLIRAGGLAGANLLLSPVFDRLKGVLPEIGRKLSVQEILKRFPKYNPAITAVNLSYAPGTIYGQYADLHHDDEHLYIAVPYGDIAAGKITMHNPDYVKGLQEANERKQKVFYVIEIPPSPDEYNKSQWEKNLRIVCITFKGAYCFIIGNELNADYSSWHNKENKVGPYLDLFLTSAKIINEVTPETKIAPWQDAYYDKDQKMLNDFLFLLKAKGGRINILPVNYYDTSGNLVQRVEKYRQSLDNHSFHDVPIVLSEVGYPLTFPFPLSDEQIANLIVQNLSTAAWLIQEGKIQSAAWFCAYTGHEKLQSFSLAKLGKKGEFLLKPSFFAFILCQHLLTEKITILKEGLGVTRVVVGSKAQIVWNEGKKIVRVPTYGAKTILTPTGIETACANDFTDLHPPSSPRECTGETRILLF